jgi:aspartate/methionine/tyrosine aminotransferase
VGQLDDQIASFALDPSCVHALLRRNIDLAKRNLEAVEAFIEKYRWACDWVRPTAGTTAFIRFSKMGKPVNDEAFCKMLLEKAGVLLSPGSKCFGNGVEFKGYVRFGFVPYAEVLDGGLEALKGFLENGYEDVPLA